MFKKIEMQNIRQNQYNGGLLCDLAYTKKENLDLMILEPLLILKTKERDAKEEALYHRHLEGEEYPNENLALQREVAELREEVLGLGNTIYLIKTLSQKGFKIETMEQRNLENNLSAFYIENKSGEGYFVIRGTTDFF